MFKISSILQPLPYLWAFPTTAIGLLFLLPTLLTGGSCQLVDGCLEIHGTLTSLFLRYPAFNASAMTLGHVILGRDRASLNFARPHEHVHVRQCELLGPLFLPAYAAASLLALLRGKHPYWHNHFELQAYSQTPLKNFLLCALCVLCGSDS